MDFFFLTATFIWAKRDLQSPTNSPLEFSQFCDADIKVYTVSNFSEDELNEQVQTCTPKI